MKDERYPLLVALYIQLLLQDYFCSKRYVPLEIVPTWRDESKPKLSQERKSLLERSLLENFSLAQVDLSRKVSVYRGDMALLEVDAIVCPTDNYMNSGFGGKRYRKTVR